MNFRHLEKTVMVLLFFGRIPLPDFQGLWPDKNCQSNRMFHFKKFLSFLCRGMGGLMLPNFSCLVFFHNANSKSPISMGAVNAGIVTFSLPELAEFFVINFWL